MSDHEGHGHEAVLYKSHFPPLRHSVVQSHQQIHWLIKVHFKSLKWVLLDQINDEYIMGFC